MGRFGDHQPCGLQQILNALFGNHPAHLRNHHPVLGNAVLPAEFQPVGQTGIGTGEVHAVVDHRVAFRGQQIHGR